MKKKFTLLILILSKQILSQHYSYQDYINDSKILQNIGRHIRNDNIDSLKTDLADYKNRLGFTYYQCKAIIANHDSDSNQFRFLDSAFMRGMTPLCMDKCLHKFDTAKVFRSFKNNYLRSYNIRLINLVDSIHNKDQEYRGQMTYWENQPDISNTNSKKSVDGGQPFKIKVQSKSEALDSLWKLQLHTDSSNMVKLNEIIDKYGWPGAKKVGDYYCQRPGPDVTMLFIHLGNTRRDYQINTLKKVIDLCKKQDDSWQNASSLMFGLHWKFSRDFSEFSFLQIKDNIIDRTESFFSVYNMSEMLINSMSKRKIEIKCAKRSLYNDLKQFMLSMNDLIPINDRDLKRRKEQGLPGPKKLDEESFIFIESPDIKDDMIFYRIVKG